jgi:hypothetical protein
MSSIIKDILSGSEAAKSKKSILVPLMNKHYQLRDKKRNYDFLVMDGRGRPDRHDKKFHASSLTEDFCARQWVIGQHELVPIEEPTFTSAIERTFELGNYIHLMLQMTILDMGIGYGLWRCTMNDKHFRWGHLKNRGRCSECNAPMFYAEIPLDYKDEDILSTADHEIILRDRGERYNVEFKSINSHLYPGTVREPLAKHRSQALIYQFVRTRYNGRMKHLGEPKWIEKYPLKGSIILYFNKDSSEMREHIIRLTSDVEASDIDPILEQMEEARRFKPGKLKTLPARVCENQAEGAMRKCPFIEPCFNTFPPVIHRRKKERV